MKILAFESSCDESALALFDSNKGMELESVSTQIALHAQYGGVVPELAAREHLTNFPLILREAAEKILASAETIDAVAVTHGPGLAGCLALGISLARTVAICLGKPIIPVNHLRGHLFSSFIPLHESDPANFATACKSLFPHLGLVVSGGNTLLVEVDRECHVKILAETVDDAAGEAFDKGAKLLGMPYPGGALIEKHARDAKISGEFSFPSGDAIKREPRFSFSGLKTSLRYRLEKMSDAELADSLPEICADYQDAIVRQLVNKTVVQFEKKHFASIGLSGGVSNNETLRSAFRKLADAEHVPFLAAKPKHTGDNAGMIAFAAWFEGDHASPLSREQSSLAIQSDSSTMPEARSPSSGSEEEPMAIEKCLGPGGGAASPLSHEQSSLAIQSDSSTMPEAWSPSSGSEEEPMAPGFIGDDKSSYYRAEATPRQSASITFRPSLTIVDG